MFTSTRERVEKYSVKIKEKTFWALVNKTDKRTNEEKQQEELSIINNLKIL